MTRNISKTYHQQEWQTITLLGLFAMLIIGYIFLTYTITFETKNIEGLERQIDLIAKEITGLETKTLALRNDITLPLAYSLGFLDSESRASYLALRGHGQE